MTSTSTYITQQINLRLEIEGKSGIELRNYLKDKFYIQRPQSYSHINKILRKIDKGDFYDHIHESEQNENCEHVVPQSYFHSKSPMVSDLHHLYLCGMRSNCMRSNMKFDDIENNLNLNTKWIIDDKDFKNSIKPDIVDEYSEFVPNVCFEPKKSSRGNVARSVAYFFTMYPEYLNIMNKVMDISTMIEWNKIDPVDEIDIKRNYDIYDIQYNLNPYILCPELVAQAFNDL